MSSSVANGNTNGDSSVYANNRGCLPLYKKEFLPHGLCHFYLRHGYCKNRANCRWDHPPLGDRPDYRYVNNDREDGGVHNLGYNGYNEAYSAEGHNKNKKDRKYHNRDDFKSHSDNRDNRDNKSNYKDYHKDAHKDPHTNTSHGLHATHSPHSHGSTSHSHSHRANKSNFDSSQYDKDNHRDIAGKFDKYDHHRDRDRDRHRDKYHDKPGDKPHLSALPNIIKDHRIHSKHKYDKDIKRDMDRDRNRNRDRNREKDRDKNQKRADKANRDRDKDRDREKGKMKKVKLETVAYNDTDTEDDDDDNDEMDETGPSEVEEGEIQEDFVLDALKNTTSATSTPGHTATASKPKPKGNEQKKEDSKSKDNKATTKSTTSTPKKSKKSKLSKAKHDKIKHEKSHKKSTDSSTNNSKKSKSKTKTKKKSKTKSKKSTVKKEKESANIIPPPPPPKAQNKPAAKDNEEQISECPDWINKQVCDSFRSCPHFHDGVECDTWVEYGKCPEKENGKCNDFHHRSIWIQTCIKDNSHSHHKDTHSKKDKKTKKEHTHKSSASKKDKAASTPTRKGQKEHKSSKVCYDGKERERDRDNVKRMRGVSMASHVSVSSISSTCSDQTRELQVLKVNVARMVKTKRKVYKTELKQLYFDTFAHELNIEEYGYLNIVSFLKSIKCLAMHQGSNGSPLIVYNSANMNNLRYRKINRNRNRSYNHQNNGYQHKMYDDDDYYNGYVNFKNQGHKNRNNYNGNYNNANNGFSQMNKMNPNGCNQNNPYVGNGYESNKKRPFYAMAQHSKFNAMQNQREPPSKKRRKNSF